MNSVSRIWAHGVIGTMLFCACASNNGSSSGSGGSTSGSSGNGGSSSGNSGGNNSTSNSGGSATTTTASTTTNTGGRVEQATSSGGSGGTPSSSAGGATFTTTSATTGAPGGGQGGTATLSSITPVPSSGGSGGTSGALSGGTAGKNSGAPEPIGNPRQVLLLDEGNRRVLRMDLQSPSAAVWSRQIDPAKYGDSMRDIQLVGGDRVAISVSKGYVELDVKTGEIKKEVTNFVRIESLRRLPNGNTILGSNDGGVTLQELDARDVAVPERRVTFTALQDLRLFRRTPQGSFLLGLRSKLVEVNWDKQILWEMAIPNGDYVYMGLRQDNYIAVTSGYGAALVILEPTGKKVVATIGGKTQPDSATIAPNFYAGFQILANGHYVVTNWQGHGSTNGTKGIQLLEYDAAGTVVWKWKQDPKLVSSLHHVMVLDGLDTTKLHDDLRGALAPATQ